MDPIGGTLALVFCRFERTGWTGEIEHLKSGRYVEAYRLHGRIIGNFDLSVKRVRF